MILDLAPLKCEPAHVSANYLQQNDVFVQLLYRTLLTF